MREYRSRLYRTYYTASYKEASPLEDRERRRRLATLKALLLPWLPADRDAKIVDLGCGIGYAVEMLIQQGYRSVQGIDVSEEQVAVARSRGLPVHRADVFEYLGGRRDEFDAVLALDFIEHLDRDELLAFLDGVARALRPGGRLVVKTPNANAVTAARSRYRDLTHELIFTDHSLRMAFVAGGLRPLAVFGERVPPGSLAGVGRWALAAVGRLAWRLLLMGELGREALRIPLEFNLIGVAEKPSTEARG